MSHRSRKKSETIKIALDMLRHSQRGKREVWHALLNPAPLFAFDSKSHNDIQVLTRLRNEALTEGERDRDRRKRRAQKCVLLT